MFQEEEPELSSSNHPKQTNQSSASAAVPFAPQKPFVPLCSRQGAKDEAPLCSATLQRVTHLGANLTQVRRNAPLPMLRK